jgi:hypothetical protein
LHQHVPQVRDASVLFVIALLLQNISLCAHFPSTARLLQLLLLRL